MCKNIVVLQLSSFLSIVAVSITVGGCGTQDRERTAVTVAIEGDIDTFNPLFAREIVAGEINDLLFPRLIHPEFNASQGSLEFTPYLAKSWEFSSNQRDVTFHLRTDFRWSDSVAVTARDVQFSFELYGDTIVASVRQSAVQNFRRTNGKLEVAKSMSVLTDSTIVFHFEQARPGQLFDVGLPIVPSHIFSGIPRKEIRTSAHNKTPTTAGPFAIARWNPLQEVVLEPTTFPIEPFTPKLAQLVFKILPDYRTRVEQLKSGEVDIVSGLRLEEAELPSQYPSIKIISTVGRDYDFIGWNNIDPETYTKAAGREIRPHPLFGSSRVRRALTMAINRREIVRAYLGEHGQEAIGGVSPLFRWAYNDTLQPLPFDKAEAANILEKEGWRDSDGDGILDKRGVKFMFTLKLASGNQLRNLMATVIQQQLKEVKIEMKIEQVERGTFWSNLMQRSYDAWFAGFSVPLQMQLDDLWGSDLRKYPFNLAGFRHPRVDAILADVRSLSDETEGAHLWKEFQAIVYDEQPYTFLFWINNITGVRTRVQGTHIGILGTTHNAWEWRVETPQTR
ncbi:MAG: hypothetical protein KF749_13175 [Bacteroidetes bacterium]|nr:hypothetical protein [Bacteroidota bacterium]MCW5894352.1 hypothetical protein [Bacteroidota bacterium]